MLSQFRDLALVWTEWAIGGTALLYHSLNILPFKDGMLSPLLVHCLHPLGARHLLPLPCCTMPNAYAHTPSTCLWPIVASTLPYLTLPYLWPTVGFYSSTARQDGGQTVGPETHPDREALIATLSGAMVAPMDGIHLLNASRVNATCRSDGVILKPDVPVQTSDECFRTGEDPQTCFVYATHSVVKGVGRVHYLFSNDARPLTPRMLAVAEADVDSNGAPNADCTHPHMHTCPPDMQTCAHANTRSRCGACSLCVGRGRR